MPGQINRGTTMGDMIYAIAKSSDIKTIVEIGAWNGLGTTKCLRDAVIDSNKKDFVSYSIEACEGWYKTAIDNNPSIPNFNIIHGRIIELDDIPIVYSPPLSGDEPKWLEDDIKFCKSCPNVLHMLPRKIDLLLLDGGEFTSEKEFEILSPRSKHIFMDDTSDRCRKFTRVRKAILNNDQYQVIHDDLNDRNGWMYVINTTCQ